MICKTLEIRDRMTFIPALAIQLDSEGDERARYLLSRAGFGIRPENHREYVILISLNDNRCSWDPYEWGSSRTMANAHDFIIKNFAALESGAVVDVEFILGESKEPKRSEAGH